MTAEKSKDFFIIMNHPNRNIIIPIVDDKDNVVLFHTEKEARICMRSNEFAQTYGYEIFERGTGSNG